ncbi:MAG: glycoside hydrolase family 5 protein [Gemmataceae bacterium]|nr:glycoside hydrolase family 5 protein [Gemmataceae bacterium]
MKAHFVILVWIWLVPIALCGELPLIAVSPDGSGFVEKRTGRPFVPWGFNYDHDSRGRLIEDYWLDEWPLIESHFREMKQLGANTVRIHLQLARFMDNPSELNRKNLTQLQKLLALAESIGLYLNITGLGCYHKADVPSWYDDLPENGRWQVQANFWHAVANCCRNRPVVLCYDLMNEPVVPYGKRQPKDWLGPAFANKHFVQLVSLDQSGRPRHEIARSWIRHLVRAIRSVDQDHLITVGLVDWSLDVPGMTSGFIPEKIASELDFLSVHVYPKKGQIKDALTTLRRFCVGKPVLIEETFPLNCPLAEFADFIRQSRELAAGWLGFYWGKPMEQLRASKTIADAMMLQWLEYFETTSKGLSAPLELEFKGRCGPLQPEGQPYDARRQMFRLRVEDISRFTITSVVPDIKDRGIILQISGMLEDAEGPLTMFVPDRDGQNREYRLHHVGYDQELFQIRREGGVATIEFLRKGRELLKPGVWFQYIDFYR